MTYSWTSDSRPLPQPPAPKRYGIIPCRRCAFFVPVHRLPDGSVYDGKCAHDPKTLDKSIDNGCGDGLLREEAAPLPPEQQEPKP